MTSQNAASPAEMWANLRRLYPIYCALAREAALECPSCHELDEAHETPTGEAIAAVEEWFAAMDEKIQIQHLRQFAQTSSLVNETVLRDLLLHNLAKKTRAPQDRDQVDFLLVQLFSEQAPEDFSEADLSLEAVAKVLGSAARGEHLFFRKAEAARTVIVDFSSPNIAKPGLTMRCSKFPI